MLGASKVLTINMDELGLGFISCPRGLTRPQEHVGHTQHGSNGDDLVGATAGQADNPGSGSCQWGQQRTPWAEQREDGQVLPAGCQPSLLGCWAVGTQAAHACHQRKYILAAVHAAEAEATNCIDGPSRKLMQTQQGGQANASLCALLDKAPWHHI